MRGRLQLWALWGTLLCTAPSASAAVPVVHYKTEVSSGSWEPISKRDIARTIEATALEELTKPALMRLQREAKSPADYQLHIRGALLDEAETHTVYLTFGPGQKADVPSLNSSHTVVLSRKSRGKMLDLIRGSAKRAAAQLIKVLTPPLKRARRGNAVMEPPKDPFLGVKKLPFQWAAVRVPSRSVGRAAKEIYSKKRKVRQAALRELTSLALTEPSPRNTLERCALEHKNKEMRLGCLIALRPLSRRIAPTRRIVIEVFRKDDYSRARDEAKEQMLYFSGVSRTEAIQAFMEAAASAKTYGPLAKLGDLPNLDLAIRKCLLAAGKRKRSDNKNHFRCISLLEPLPHARRVAILWRFLEETNPDSPYYLPGAGKSEGRIGTPWGRGVEAVLKLAPAWDPKLEEILWRRYQRDMSHSAMDRLCGHGAPSKRLTKRVLEIFQTTGEQRALWALKRFVKADPKLRTPILDKLEELYQMGTYPKKVSKRQFERLLKDIRKVQG